MNTYYQKNDLINLNHNISDSYRQTTHICAIDKPQVYGIFSIHFSFIPLFNNKFRNTDWVIYRLEKN